MPHIVALACFLILSCRISKRTKFRWKSTHDISLLTEIISVEPYRWKHGSRERGEAFRKVSENLKLIPNSTFPDSLNQRGVRTRFFELLDSFKKQETKEGKASGIDAEFDEKTQLLTDIHSRMTDFENGFVEEIEFKQQKKDKEKANAEEMRRKACEKLGETSKRNELDTPSRKRKATEFVEYLKHKEEGNRQNTEKQLKLREEELKLEKQKLDLQQGMQNQILEQFKLQQQSQEAMFNILKTFIDKFKSQ